MRALVLLLLFALVGCATAPVRGDVYGSSYVHVEPRDDAPEPDTGSAGGFPTLAPLRLTIFGQSAPVAGFSTEHAGQNMTAARLTLTETSGSVNALSLNGARLGLSGTNTFLLGTASAISFYVGGGEVFGITGIEAGTLGAGRYLKGSAQGAGPPPAGDCDADAERQRQYYDTTNNRFYFCGGATRLWDFVALTD